MTELPMADGPPPRERADAARNRAKVLAAAEGLFAAGDPAAVTMDDIAKAAGIGRGTLYRRYPDRASIARALLDEHERALQEQLLRGAPPLGPGGGAGEAHPTPADRLAAFYRAMVDLLETHVHLVLGAETGLARFRTGAYAFWRLHVTHLARQAGLPDPETLADQLLAPLAPELFRHQRDSGRTPGQITAGLSTLAHGTLGR
ncbi:helix-turn-helix domain containing protein [Streptomyces sp. BE20]|uniref:TetR/AcrR family transcriptional regulator n=1 Tax=Streptomycetaceae TaxID=2062 RepID=UPI002E781E5B|nr:MULTISPECIES: helix-turn-helix domain-containing protein [unclassified Streptomyces]MED7954236.1 helix-turn-helix domain containing protein [Streptomyces sp. BE303]MEE1825718.1 helix-turn-helix domain containing protein [Streptomyces sp. BE20]